VSDQLYIVVQSVWVQTSADYHSERKTRTRAFSGDTSIADVMRWVDGVGHHLVLGDVVLTREDKGEQK
jgi:hypothetical protein